jgi:hypothetical protein
MTETAIEVGSKIAAGYGALAIEFSAASAGMAHEKGQHATTLAAAYSAFAAGYVAASAAANLAHAVTPFPMLGLPEVQEELSPLDVLTLAQTADYVQLSGDVIRSEAEAGRLVGQHVGGEWRFLRESIVQWLRTPRRQATPPKGSILSDETPEEHDAFLANIRAHRDELDRATESGKYTPE